MMEEQRLLIDRMAQTPDWYVAANEMIAGEWELDDQAEYYGQLFVDQLLAGELSVKELKGGIAWANALDKEIVETTSAPIDELEEADRREATARRVAHHAGRFAIHQVKSTRHLERLRVRAQINRHMPGMGGIGERKYAL
jgi:hypothetical protein